MFSIKNAAEFAVANRWFLCRIVFALYLVILTVMDLKRRKLKLSVLLAGGIFIPAGVFCSSGVSPVYLAAGGAVGAVFLGISKITEESFGYGDSILILIMGYTYSPYGSIYDGRCVFSGSSHPRPFPKKGFVSLCSVSYSCLYRRDGIWNLLIQNI